MRQTVGTVGSATFEKLKPGSKLLVRDAVKKAMKMRKRMGAPRSYIMEAMETEYIELLEGVTTGGILDSFVTEMVVPGLPKEVRFRSKHPFQMPMVRTKTPPMGPPPQVDEWRFGHIQGWICRDHYGLRRNLLARQVRQGIFLKRLLLVSDARCSWTAT